MEFLHPDNVAGRTLLTLVARGSAILSELLRLSDHIPNVFLAGLPQSALNHPIQNSISNTSGPQQQQNITTEAKYERILMDFKYLKQPEVYDSLIDNDVVSCQNQHHLPPTYMHG